MEDTENQNPALTLWIMWGALFMTLLIYMLVLYTTINNAASFEAPDAEFIATMRIAFGGIAVGELVAIFVVRHVMFFSKLDAGEITTAKELRGQYMTTSILSWALSESIAIYGFVLAFLTHQLVYYLVFFAPAAILFLVLRPQLGRYEEEFDQQRPNESTESVAADDSPSSGSW